MPKLSTNPTQLESSVVRYLVVSPIGNVRGTVDNGLCRSTRATRVTKHRIFPFKAVLFWRLVPGFFNTANGADVL